MKVNIADAAEAAYVAYEEVLVQLADGAATTAGWEALTSAQRETWISFAQQVIDGTADPISADASGVGTANSDKANMVATAVINSLREFH